MGGDRRQIQTAVLGSADSEEPLMLPLEAIELDAFRRRHEGDTFWCGLLLGGCGVQLATKLYTDRVCHFAHHPDPDGLPHLCGRRARGVDSADHLYLKAAARTWLSGRHYRADIDFARPDGADFGSVLDIRFTAHRLRVHLDQAVDPVWDDDGLEPVLGVSVPVDRDTLIRRWYVHRIRLDSEGTSRHVRIGTEAFARPTQWFALDDCEMTERGLSTPAVEQIIRSHRTRPAPSWSPGRTRKTPTAPAQARVLLRQLADARKVDSVVVVNRLCREIASLAQDTAELAKGELRAQLNAAVEAAGHWLREQAQARQELFSRLEEAVAAADITEAGRLLRLVNATADHDRTETETAIAASAVGLGAAYAQQQQAEAAARRAEQADLHARQEADRARSLLATLEQRRKAQGRKTMRKLVKELVHAATGAGAHLDPTLHRQIEAWKERADIAQPPKLPRRPAPDQRAAPRRKKTTALYEQVEQRSWYKKPCPHCRAATGKPCVNDDGIGNGPHRQLPHDERLQAILGPRKPATQQSRKAPAPLSQPPAPPRPEPRVPSWTVLDIACPSCNAGPGSRCATPDHHPHQPRVARFRNRFPSR